MRNINNIALLVIGSLILLSLVACIAKPNVAEPSLITTSTSFAPSALTSINPNNLNIAYTPSPTSIPSSFIPLSPTEQPSSILSGRVLFEGDVMKNGIKSHGIVGLDIKTNETTLLFKNRQEVNGKSISLHYPSITWSPDGHWFAFVGTDADTDDAAYPYQDIYVVKSDGTEVHRLTESPQYQKFSIAWSPDKNYLLVAMGIEGSNLYLIDSTSGAIARRLTTDANSYSAAWSPNGKQIAFEIYNSMAIMNVEDETSQTLHIPYNLAVKDISWAPNHNQIVFSSNSLDCTDIFMINVNTGGFINLTSSNNYENSPVWLPDGKHIAFSRSTYSCKSDQGSWEIYAMNLFHEEYQLMSNVTSWTTIAWAPVPNLELGRQYTVTELGSFLNLRTKPSLEGNILEKLPANAVITVLDGYVDADDYYWWKVRAQDGTEGWAVEVANWYKPLIE